MISQGVWVQDLPAICEVHMLAISIRSLVTTDALIKPNTKILRCWLSALEHRIVSLQARVGHALILVV